jgi:regulatory protein
VKRPRTLKARALQLLAQREQSRVELRRKLLAHALAPDEAAPVESGDDSHAVAAAAQVEEVLAWLEANGFLSAERFAESRVNARVARFGNLRIRQELARHEIALTPDAAQALVGSELDRARAVRDRKYRTGPLSAAERARQARFLLARGFSADVVRRVLREARPAADAAAERESEDA